MPEVKHQFTGGKMNKDLDERLVPNGEYRDALNIQVSTSEGSDVGTAQNILGNSLVPGQDFIDDNSYCVGSVSDEKNDVLYWMISGKKRSLSDFQQDIVNSNVTTPTYNRDLIVSNKNDNATPVVVDKYASLLDNYASNTFNDNFIVLPTSSVPDVITGMTVTGIRNDGSITSESPKVKSVGGVSELVIAANLLSVVTPTLTTLPLPFSLSRGAHIAGTSNPKLYEPLQYIYVASNIWGPTNTWGLQVGDSISIKLPPNNTANGLGTGATITSIETNYSVAFGNKNTQLVFASYTKIGVSTAIMNWDDSVAVGYPKSSNSIFLTTGGLGDAEIISTINVSSFSGTVLLPSSNPWSDNVENEMEVLTPSVQYPNGGFVRNLTQVNGGYEIQVFTNKTGGSLVIPAATRAPLVDKLSFSLPSSIVTALDETLIELSGNLDLSGDFYNYLHFEGDRTLNFNKENLITGVNIIDDMLFWTDNNTEPKKINIPRCIEGTDHGGQKHTRLINSETGGEIFLTEEHVSVIKKKPTTPLTLTQTTDREDGVNYSGRITVSNNTSTTSFTSVSLERGHTDFNRLSAGDRFQVVVPSDLDGNTDFKLTEIAGNPDKLWSVGTKVLLKEYDDGGSPPTVPISEYTIKGVVVAWWENNFDSANGDVQVNIEILSIDGFVPQAEPNSTLNFAVDVFNESERLFEFKFPRFSYRYKYQDGEYSAYAPFSGIAFSPGTFDHHPKKGYNTGMTNRLKSVVLKNFVTQDMPSDVVEIDLLYKEDASSTVYVVDTVKPKSPARTGESFNNWDRNEFEITSDIIHAALPENQLLRPWDNVPRRALAQEVTGNRIVYGNYLQNYNLSKDSEEFLPEFRHSITTADKTDISTKSIKSLRDYQLGVVFIDKYGRETPVISNQSGAFKIEKERANEENRLRVGFMKPETTANVPEDFKYYKFFIKETSGEYYNMAMDRFYDAEDENHWLAFPSSDRNKVDIDTILILKKGPDSDDLIFEPARYKIIAIENEAPDFIKTTKYNIAQVVHNMLTNSSGGPTSDLFGSTDDNAPFEGRDSFSMSSVPFEISSAKNIHEIKEDLYVEFGSSVDNRKSDRYRIANISKEDDEFYIKLDKVLGSDVGFVSEKVGTGHRIKNLTEVNIYKYVVENKPKFDGRFFVKIYADDVFSNRVKTKAIAKIPEYRVNVSRKIFALNSNHTQIHTGDYGHSVYNSGTPFTFHLHANGEASSDVGPIQADHTIADVLKFGGPDGDDPNTPANLSYMSYKAYYGNWVISGNTGFEYNSFDELDATVVNDVDSLYMPKITNFKKWEPFSKHAQPALERDFVVSIDEAGYEGHHWVSWKFSGKPDSSVSLGIRDFGGTTEGAMDLSFGSIQPKDGWKWEKWMPFWDLENREDSKYDFIKPFLKEINAGKKFRWKEDPTGTVYTIVRQTTSYNKLNFSTRHLNNYDDEDYGEDEVPRHDDEGRAYNRPYNYRLRKRFHFQPSMKDGWDPTGSAGPIPNGLSIDKFYNSSTDGYQTIKSTSSSNNSQNPNKVLIPASHFENSVDSITNNTPKRLEVGMILNRLLDPTESSNSQTNAKTHSNGYLIHKLLIKEITEIAQGYEITFAGYTDIDDEIQIAVSSSLSFRQPTMNGLSVASARNISEYSGGSIEAVGYNLEFVEPIEEEALLPESPAVWETEPKESTDLDIYYEISGSNPVKLDRHTIKTAIPIGSKVKPLDGDGGATSELKIINNESANGNIIIVSEDLRIDYAGFGDRRIRANDTFKITRPDGVSVNVYIEEILEHTVHNFSCRAFKIKTFLYNNNIELTWHNCFAFGNGVESNRIRDNFNLPYISNGVKASTTLGKEYKEEHRKYGLIYSGIYNSTSGVNNLNQFIQAEKITKDLNPIYGSIQKLHSRSTADGDLLAFCEDRVLKILANKDALYNADGNPQLTATNNVLGQATPYSGEYGISTNPESFASESYRVYFSDRVRGAIMRLSKDGLTPISDAGMKDWFRDNLSLGVTNLLGQNNLSSQNNWDIVSSGNSAVINGEAILGYYNSDVNHANYGKTARLRMNNVLEIGKTYRLRYDVVEHSGLAHQNGNNSSITVVNSYPGSGWISGAHGGSESRTNGGRVDATWTANRTDFELLQYQVNSPSGKYTPPGGTEDTVQNYVNAQRIAAGWPDTNNNGIPDDNSYSNSSWLYGGTVRIKNLIVEEVKEPLKIIGSYDDRQDEYNVSIHGTNPTTVTFKEDVRGWVSFKSFKPENGVSCANNYYTMLNGKLWQHHNPGVNRNKFYDVDYNSSLNVLLNDSPGSVKSFHTLGYEGSQSKVEGVKRVSVTGIEHNFGASFDGRYAFFEIQDMNKLFGTSNWHEAIFETKQYRNNILIHTGLVKAWANYGNSLFPASPSGGPTKGHLRRSFGDGYQASGGYYIANAGDFEVGDIITTQLQEDSVNHFNMTPRNGWYVSDIETDKQSGSLNEFLEKEGRWFNHIKGLDYEVSTETDFAASSIQGIGILSSFESNVLMFNSINASLQIGDTIYYQTPSTNGSFDTIDSNSVNKYGRVTAFTNKSITVKPTDSSPSVGDFIFFAKNNTINTSSLLGYYADVKLENDSKAKAEIFSISSEITESSK